MLTFVNFLGGRTYDLANQADLWFLLPCDHLSANHKKIVVIDILLALATSSLLLYHQNIAFFPALVHCSCNKELGWKQR